MKKRRRNISVHVEPRPSAGVKDVKDVLINCERYLSSLGLLYHVVIMRGASDIPRSEMNYIKSIKKTVAIPTCMNVVVLSVPTMHDLTKESVVNKEIRNKNADANKICKRFSNVQVRDINIVSRAYLTEDGWHLNRIGKEVISSGRKN
jgi:hypothetical protein